MDNFQLAEKYMLPQETNTTSMMIQIDKFLNKHLLFEYFNFDSLSQYYIEDNFSKFSEKLKEDFHSPKQMWNIFEF